MNTLPLQLEFAGKALLDYGLSGIIIIGLCWYLWKLISQQQKYTEGWREEATQNGKALIELSQRQISIQEKQADIQEKQIAQTKEFYDSISRQIEAVPGKVIERTKLENL